MKSRRKQKQNPKQMKKKDLVSRLQQAYELTKNPLLMEGVRAIKDGNDPIEVLFSIVIVQEKMRIFYGQTLREADMAAKKIIGAIVGESGAFLEKLTRPQANKKEDFSEN